MTNTRPGARTMRRGSRTLRAGCLGLLLPAMLATPFASHAQDDAAAAAAADATEVAAVAPPVMPAQVVFESSVGDVAFPHNTHLRFGCNACHHQIHAAPLDTPHPDYMTSSWIRCQGCHAAEPALPGPYYRCDLCHHAEPHSIADETLSAKVVLHQSCWKCHESGTGVAASRGCGDCHVREEQLAEDSDG